MSTDRHKFAGTENPRQLVAILELMRRALFREKLDAITGVSNGPDLAADLCGGGLELPCKLITVTDRDRKEVGAGLYSLTAADCRLYSRWLANTIKDNAA